MSVDDRFEAFKAAYAAGEDPDPRAAIEGLTEKSERAQLLLLIDAFLARAPARAWDPEAFEQFRSGPLARRVASAVAVQAEAREGERLGDLRVAAQLPREQLVAALTTELAASERRAKVADYYHRLEWGTLDPRRVSGRVYDALARVLGVSAERVRLAAARAMPPPAAPMHARAVHPDPSYQGEEAVAPAAAAPPPAKTEPAEQDEIDLLFLGDEPRQSDG